MSNYFSPKRNHPSQKKNVFLELQQRTTWILWVSWLYLKAAFPYGEMVSFSLGMLVATWWNSQIHRGRSLSHYTDSTINRRKKNLIEVAAILQANLKPPFSTHHFWKQNYIWLFYITSEKELKAYSSLFLMLWKCWGWVFNQWFLTYSEFVRLLNTS